ncbi:MAG: MGMT family protein [Nanoarchaeota archaeon]
MKFNERCYTILKQIPKGKVTTYKALAHAIGSRAYRAVGTAMKKNTDAPHVPCHRVVNSDGKVGNYSSDGGGTKKISLLKQEGIIVKNGKVDLKKYEWHF